MQGSFSHDLDEGPIHGNGTPPNPFGVLGIASNVAGATLLAAASAALAEIGEAGGAGGALAVSPTAYASAASDVGADGHLVYPNGLTGLLELTIVQVPGLTNPLVYDQTGVRLLVARNFAVQPSTDYGPAYQTDSVALRISGRFAVACPTPSKAIRKLTVTPVVQTAQASKSSK